MEDYAVLLVCAVVFTVAMAGLNLKTHSTNHWTAVLLRFSSYLGICLGRVVASWTLVVMARDVL
jgi:hypothetical protein